MQCFWSTLSGTQLGLCIPIIKEMRDLPGRSWDFTKAKLYTDFSGVQKNGWRLWPLASWITYQYIPLRLRVLFVNVVAFFWCVSVLPNDSICLLLCSPLNVVHTDLMCACCHARQSVTPTDVCSVGPRAMHEAFPEFACLLCRSTFLNYSSRTALTAWRK